MRIFKKSTLCTGLSILLCFSLLLSGCGYSKEETDDKLASVQEQIDSIKSSIPTFEQTGTELNAYIDSLKAATADLQSKLDATNAAIEALKSDMSTADAEVFDDLNALKASIEDQIATINTDIKALQAKDTELAGKITSLETTVSTLASKDWVNATFATLSQYEQLQTIVSGIQNNITTINTNIAAIESDVAAKVKTINQSISDLDAKLANKVTEITAAYTEAITSAKSDITAAYTTAIATAITNSETSMKTWVMQTLTDGYYTISQVDAALSTMESKLEKSDTEIKTELTAQKTALESAKATLTQQYKAAIETAINEYDGKITAKVATDISAAKTELQGKIDTINTELSSIKQRLTALETDVAALLAQIQSVNYIPMYDDGKVKVASDNSGNKYAFFDFMVSPKSALANIDEATLTNYLSMQAIYTKRAETRGDEQNTVSFVDMQILDVSYNATTGVLTVKASGDKLNADFYNADVYASAFLTVKTGKTEIISDYIPMVAHSSVWVDVVTVEDWIKITLNGGIAEEVTN